MFDVNTSLIRHWENYFDILKPRKNRKGNRLFTNADIENLKIIYHLVKERGMHLSAAAIYLKNNSKGIERDVVIVEKLQNVRALLYEVLTEIETTEQEQEEVIYHNRDLYH